MPAPVFWGPDFRLNRTTTGEQYEQKIVSLTNGSFVAVWISQSGGTHQVVGQLYNAAGTPQTGEFVINSTPISLNIGLSFDAVGLKDGRFAVVWSGYGPDIATTERDIRARVFNPDGTPFNRGGAEGHQDFVVNTTVLRGNQGAPTLAALDNGGFVVSYTDEGTGAEPDLTDTRAQVFGAAGQPVGPSDFIMNLQQAGNQSNHGVAALNNGTYVAIYYDSTTSQYRGRFFTADGLSQPGVEFVVASDPNAAIQNLKVAALSNGRFVVTWDEGGAGGDGSGLAVKAQIFEANGATFKTAFQVNATTNDDQTRPNVVALPDGGFAVVYYDLSVATGAIRLATFGNDGARLGDEIRADTPSPVEPYDPTVSVLADGRLVVTWGGTLEQNQDVYARIVDPRVKAVALSGTFRDDQYIGTGLHDRLGGAAGADHLRGEGGNDTLDGGSGIDRLDGGLGNDLYRVDTSRDVVLEARSGGRDTVIASASYALRSDAEVEVLKLSGVSSRAAANLTGSNYGNEISGHAGVNTLKGQGGNDALKASSGNDKLYGGSGNDTLWGGSGNDTLKGESGRDTFVFDTRPNKTTNVDRIYDFRSKDDKIWLDNKVFTKLGSGSLSKPKKFGQDMFVKGKKAKDAEDRIVYDKGTGALYYDADGSGSKAQVKIATIANKTKLYYHDFFVI